jgi:hypothetical protein
MEVYQSGEFWVKTDGSLEDDMEFSHTTFIVKGHNHEVFYAITKDRTHTPSAEDMNQLDLVPILAQDIWPPFSDQFSQATEPSPSKDYIKKPNLLDYNLLSDPTEISRLVLQEASVCEILKANPPPNVAVYKRLRCYRWPHTRTLSGQVRDDSHRKSPRE